MKLAMHVCSLLLIIICATTIGADTLSPSQQFVLDATRRAIPALSTVWTKDLDSNIDAGCETVFPGVICSDTNIVSLDLGSIAELEGQGGTIPQELSILSNLTVLRLNGLDLTGTIPPAIVGFALAVEISLENNRLSGTIPPFLVSPNLAILRLGNNNFDGTIPAVSSLKLNTFDVDSNKLNGTIPYWLGNPAMTSLTNVNTTTVNSFTGCPPRIKGGSKATSCSYFTAGLTSCECYTECDPGSYCVCGPDNSPVTSCVDFSTVIYTDKNIVLNPEFVQIQSKLYFRCFDDTGSIVTLCVYDGSVTSVVSGVVNPIHLTSFNDELYFVQGSLPVWTLVAFNTTLSTVATLSGTTQAPSAIVKGASSLFVADNVTVLSVSETTRTVGSIDSYGLLAVSTDTPVFESGGLLVTPSYPLCPSLNYSDVRDLTASTADTVLFTAVISGERRLVSVSSVSSPTGVTCVDLLANSSLASVVVSDGFTPVTFNNYVFFVGTTTSNVTQLFSCSLPNCSTANTYSPAFNSSTYSPLLYQAQGHLFVVLDDDSIRYLSDPVSTLTIFQTQLGASGFTDFKVFDSKAFAISGTNLLTFDMPNGWLTVTDSSSTPFSLPTGSTITTYTSGTSTYVLFFDSNSKTVRTYWNMYNACNFPNSCTYAGTTCSSDIASTGSVKCGSAITCPSSEVLVYDQCIQKLLCALNNGGCKAGTNCVITEGTVDCKDVDQCQDGTDLCVNRTCVNIDDGLYTCGDCPEGYKMSGLYKCIDINECDTNPCDIHANCTNTNGSYLCTCMPGFTGDGKTIGGCTTTDACGFLAPCSVHANCTNTGPGTYSCHCLPGYTGNGTVCSNINECANSSACLPGTNCTDLNGSFECTCPPGYVGDPHVLGGCHLGNCSNATTTCDVNATCDVSQDTFTCRCKLGFTGNPYTYGGCFMNLCTETPGPCSANANCTAMPNEQVQCTCHSGYSGNGYTCSNIDECSRAIPVCAKGANCTDTEGSFTCTCPPGFTGDPYVGGCIDSCSSTSSSPCGSNSVCNNTSGFTCSCAGSPLTCGCVLSSSQPNFTCLAGAQAIQVSTSVSTGNTPVTFSGKVTILPGASLEASSPLTFTQGLVVEGTFTIPTTSQVTVNGPISTSGSGLISIQSGAILAITNCSGSLAAGSIHLDVTDTQTAGSVTVISAPCSIVAPDAVDALLSSCPGLSAVQDQTKSGLVVEFQDTCVSAPSNSSEDSLLWLWILLGVIGFILIVLILLFAIPASRRKILGSCTDNDDTGNGRESALTKANEALVRQRTTPSTSERKGIPNPPFNVTAIADYMAVDTSQISVTKGIIYTVQRVDEGQHWFQAKGANGKLGWFPASYARIEQ